MKHTPICYGQWRHKNVLTGHAWRVIDDFNAKEEVFLDTKISGPNLRTKKLFKYLEKTHKKRTIELFKIQFGK